MDIRFDRWRGGALLFAPCTVLAPTAHAAATLVDFEDIGVSADGNAVAPKTLLIAGIAAPGIAMRRGTGRDR